jgi:hypothetical protein
MTRKVILDADTVKAIFEAGPGALVCGPDGQSLGQLFPDHLVERLAARSSQPLPIGCASMAEFYEKVRTKTPPTDVAAADRAGAWLPHAEAMRRLGLE